MIAVEIRDFQSIERVTFQIDGFTSLVGRSNIGKSALIRAIKCALTGAPVAAFVRHGAACARKVKGQKTCKCHVSVKLKSEGFDLLWEKGDAVNRYVFNGAAYPAAERGMPDFLTAHFNEVKVGDKDILLQVADQFQPIFLLDQSGTAVADVLSDMAKLDRVNVASRMAEKDRKDAVATRKVREKDLLDAKTKLASFDSLETTVRDVRSLQEKHREIQERRAKVVRLTTLGRTFANLEQQADLLGGVSNLHPPDPATLHQARSRYTTLQGMIARARDQKAALTTLGGIGSISVPLGPVEVKALAETSQRLTAWVNLFISFRTTLARFQAIPIPTLPALPSAEEHRRIAALVARLETLTKALSSLEEDHRRAVDEEKTVKAEWEALGVCSTCARPFHPEPYQVRV